MNRKTLLIIVAAIAVVLLWPLADRSMSVYAQAITSITNEKFHLEQDLDFENIIGCFGEPLHLVLDFHEIFKVTIDPEGKVHLSYHNNNMNAKATGPSGTVYTGNQTLMNNFENVEIGPGLPPFEVTIRVNSVLNSHGAGPNLKITVFIHVTVKPNGEVSSDINRTTYSCE